MSTLIWLAMGSRPNIVVTGEEYGSQTLSAGAHDQIEGIESGRSRRNPRCIYEHDVVIHHDAGEGHDPHAGKIRRAGR